ncbi:NAD-binding protein [Candidatus Margulisiibacteriota bacterium]
MYVIICGGGKVGYSLAKRLAEEKNKVILIERDLEKCKTIAKDIKAIVIHGDACEPKYLEEATAEKADVIVAVTGDDEDNLVICQLAKTYYSVPRTVARVNDPRNEFSFVQLGVDVPVNATNVIAQVINQEVSLDELSTLLKFKQGKISIVQGKITNKSALLKKQLKNIKLPQNCIIVSILRKEHIIVPKGDTQLKKDDEVLAVTTAENEKQFHKILTG